jgi:hypothetical protein
MERDDLADLHEMLPGITEVGLYPILADSVRGTRIEVTAAEQRPIDTKEMTAAGIELGVEACRWNLWVNTFSAPIEVKRGFQIVESDGTTWVIASARKEMMKTRWACECQRDYVGDE